VNDLFGNVSPKSKPLAAKIRPQRISDYLGPEHILGGDQPLRKLIDRGRIHSLILWGPPGVGKTTLARIIANEIDADFIELSAVLSGAKEIRAAIIRCQDSVIRGRQAIVFIDEIHRFNKAQQDAFLPYVEDGTFTLIGATTENPSFEVNNALISRMKVYKLEKLSDEALSQLVTSALSELGFEQNLGSQLMDRIISFADGDGRRCAGAVEELFSLYGNQLNSLSESDIAGVLTGRLTRLDKGGEQFYDLISAFHKSVRGSSPDGALYWMARMLQGGVDPFYIIRRMVSIASEDIGNADPRALEIALNCWHAVERQGLPEGELAMAQAATYLASAAKSNASYIAWKTAKSVAAQADHEVPMHLRNAPTKLMSDLGYGEGYRYAHDEENAYAAGERYLPREVAEHSFYHPVERGLEIKIKQKLEHLAALDRASVLKRD